MTQGEDKLLRDTFVDMEDRELSLIVDIDLLRNEISLKDNIIEKLKQEQKEQLQKIKKLEKNNNILKESIKEKNKKIKILEKIKKILNVQDKTLKE